MAPVTLHCKPGCPHCDRAETLLRDLRVPYDKVVYLPDAPDYAERRDALFDMNGHRSFPNVFVGAAFVGGFKELVQANESMRLDALLEAAGHSLEDAF